MKKYHTIMLALFIIIISLSAFALGYITANVNHENNRIKITEIRLDEDNANAVSVTFIENGKEYGLDFITYDELNQLIN